MEKGFILTFCSQSVSRVGDGRVKYKSSTHKSKYESLFVTRDALCLKVQSLFVRSVADKNTVFSPHSPPTLKCKSQMT